MRALACGLALGTAVWLAANTALALHNQPFKGKSFKTNIVTGYEPCTTPNTVTDDGLPACNPPQRTDPICGFGLGQGKLQLKAQSVGNTAVRVKLNGLDPGCEGTVLTFAASLRRTGHHCGATPCTLVDAVEVPIGACAVQRATCKASGHLVFPGGTSAGQIEIREIVVRRGGLRAFRIGIIGRRP
jgi:hypothetical protein